MTFWLILGAFTQQSETFIVDPKTSSITWEGKTIAGSGHTGTIQISSGSLVVNSGKVSNGQFEVDVKSVKTTDLTGDRAVRLDNHLKSEDFFDTEKFPTAKFVITAVSVQNNEAKITGDITIKNIKKTISFPAQINLVGDKLTAKATVKINRTDFDVKYRSGNFFSGLGDRAISDEFELNIELQAKKK